VDDAAHIAGVGGDHGPAVSHDHFAIIEKQIAPLLPDPAEHPRKSLGVLKPVLIMTGDRECRRIWLLGVLPRIADSRECQYETVVVIVIPLPLGEGKTRRKNSQ